MTTACDPHLSRRHFSRMSDAELFRLFVDRPAMRTENVGRANREARRRAAKAGLGGACEWLDRMAEKGD